MVIILKYPFFIGGICFSKMSYEELISCNLDLFDKYDNSVEKFEYSEKLKLLIEDESYDECLLLLHSDKELEKNSMKLYYIGLIYARLDKRSISNVYFIKSTQMGNPHGKNIFYLKKN
jgi:hypothetical protein